MFKHILLAAFGLALLAATAAHAQSATTVYTQSGQPVTIQPQPNLIYTNAAGAQTAAVTAVVVRLPDGSLISVDSNADTPWWKDPRISSYNRYFFDPAQNAYVVTNDEATKHWPKTHEEKHGTPGTPPVTTPAPKAQEAQPSPTTADRSDIDHQDTESLDARGARQ